MILLNHVRIILFPFQVRVSDKFMSAKSEFSYMSGMSTDRDPNSVYTASSERKASSSQPTLASSPSCSTSAHEDSSSPSDPCDSDYDPGRHHDDTRPSSPNVNQNDHQQNGHRSKARSAHQKDCTSDSETQGRRKKPKIESHSNSDCDSASDFEDEQVNGLLSNGGFASPFPSPDHNYAISPIKIDPSESKAETEEEEVKQEPKDDETPNSRYKVLKQAVNNFL